MQIPWRTSCVKYAKKKPSLRINAAAIQYNRVVDSLRIYESQGIQKTLGEMMNQGSGFNEVTVAWQGSAGSIDTDAIPDYPAPAEHVEAYKRAGVVLLRAVFSDWVDTLRKGLQRNLENPRQFAFPCESNPDGEPGTRHATPWHQDLPYYCVDGTQTASIYVSLDAAAADVAVRFAKGSHLWNRLFYPRVFLDGADFEDSALDPHLEAVPDIDAQPGDYDIAAWSLEPGDAIVFDFRTLHGTGDAEVKSMRRAFTSRWLGDDVCYCERLGETSPPYSDHGMQPGDRMREDWFPVLWRDSSRSG